MSELINHFKNKYNISTFYDSENTIITKNEKLIVPWLKIKDLDNQKIFKEIKKITKPSIEEKRIFSNFLRFDDLFAILNIIAIESKHIDPRTSFKLLTGMNINNNIIKLLPKKLSDFDIKEREFNQYLFSYLESNNIQLSPHDKAYLSITMIKNAKLMLKNNELITDKHLNFYFQNQKVA